MRFEPCIIRVQYKLGTRRLLEEASVGNWFISTVQGNRFGDLAIVITETMLNTVVTLVHNAPAEAVCAAGNGSDDPNSEIRLH
ncbi:hypothetical protein ACF0H5_011574 [Mactra antiquata]